MSTWAYAKLTEKREESAPGTSTEASPPGVTSFVDALAALVPAEVLTVHALVLAFTTTTDTETSTTSISAPETLRGAFWGLVVLSVVLYVIPKLRQWHTLDYARAAIPPLAFVGWTMLQRATAFDAVWPSMDDANRSVIGVFIAVVLGLAATELARKADARPVTPPAPAPAPEPDTPIVTDPPPAPAV